MKRTLIYKRTHKGDPDNGGRFGIHDCMGSVRRRDFDSVIGIGGIGGQARAHGIDGKVNWIGIGSRKGPTTGKHRGPLVTFDHFVIFEEKGRIFGPLHLISRSECTQRTSASCLVSTTPSKGK
jgi:hypothetical protein